MRRAVVTGIVLAALVSGCGGGSDGTGSPSVDRSGSQGPAAAATPQVSDGQLGGAVVARPGTTKERGKVEPITGKSILPPSNAHALGAEENCTDVDIQPTPQNLQHVSDVIFCLMNAMRANNGVPALRQQNLLADASVKHSQDMVTNKFFAHDSQDGRTVVDRLKAATYIPKTGEWVVGENLAWGAGALASPKALVNAWMNSPPHRENLLSGDFVEVGMGVVYGTPSKDSDDGVTVTTDFGTRGSSGADASGTAADATGDAGVDIGGDQGGTTDTGATGAQGGVAGSRTAAKRRAAKRKKALRRCSHRHGKSKRRCVRAARRIR